MHSAPRKKPDKIKNGDQKAAAPAQSCKVYLNGHETQKELSVILRDLKAQFVTLKLSWVETGDSIKVRKTKEGYSFKFLILGEAEFTDTKNFDEMLKILEAFKLTDYQAINFRKLLNISCNEITSEIERFDHTVRLIPSRSCVEKLSGQIKPPAQTLISPKQRARPRTAQEQAQDKLIINLVVILISCTFLWWIWSYLPRKEKERADQIEKQKAAEESDKFAKQLEQERQFRPATQLYYQDSEYKSVLGIVSEGLKLYDKTTKKPFGVVTAIPSWGKVEVAPWGGMTLNRSGLHGYAITYDRSYITENFVTKK